VTTDEFADEILGRCRERIERGEAVDPEEVVRAHPEIAAELRSRFAALALLDATFTRATASPRAAPPLAGRRLGRYRLDSPLGAGGMGVVWLATDDDGARVAVKVVHPHLAPRASAPGRFLREAELGRRVRHENVVRTLDAGEHAEDGTTLLFLVMEHVEGRTLRALLDESGKLPEELCRHIGREVAKGLAALHAQGAVHRDLKPENVMICRTADRDVAERPGAISPGCTRPSGGWSRGEPGEREGNVHPQENYVVKVMDLGVARVDGDAARLSQTGAFVGSLHYAAPEQLTDSAEVDARADLHALGVLLYELATGVHPFAGGAVGAVVRRILDDAPRRAGAVDPQISPLFEELLAQLLDKDREKRPACAADVAAILALGEASAWWHRRAQEIRAATHRPLRRIRIARETAIFGRDAELALLRSLFERASAGHGQVVLIEGEAGIGKSRLVDEFVLSLWAAGEEIDFLFGSWPPGGAATASGALAAAYREHFGDEGLADVLRDRLGAAQILAPAFAALLSGLPTPTGAEPLTKGSLATCFVHVTRSLAAERTTIVLADDLHFAPQEGRALFESLAHAAPGHRVLLVGTARPEIDEKWLAQVARGGATRLALPRLGPKDLVALLRDALRSEHLAGDLGVKIAEKSDGNPFFVFEILRGLREGRFITRRADGTWATTREIREIEVPPSVVEVVQARVGDLDRADRDVLEAAACAGFEFDAAVVGDVLRVAPIPLLQRLGAIEKAHRLVRSVGRRFVFDHHQVMEVLYAGLSEPLREAYHAAIGAAMEARSGAASREPKELDGPLCVALAEHFLKAAQGPRALRYLPSALDHLERSYEHGTVIALIRRALAAPGVLAGRDRGELLLTAAYSLETLARREEERAVIDEALSIAAASGDASLSAKAHMRLGRHLVGLARFAEAVPPLLASAEVARRTGDFSSEVAAVWALGSAALGSGRYADALLHFERHVEICRERGHRRGESYALGNVGVVLSELGRLDEARAMHERNLTMAREVGDRRSEAAALMQLGLMLIDLGRFEEAREHLERARSLNADVGDRQHEALVILNLGNVEEADGRFDAAFERFRRRVALCEEIGHSAGLVVPMINLGSLLRTCGSFTESRAHLTRGLSLTREIGLRRMETFALQCLAKLCADEGDADAAERGYSDALALRRQLGQRNGEASNLLDRGALFAQRGRTDDARADLAAALALVREHADPATELLATIWSARLPGGDVDAALAALANCEARVSQTNAMEARFLLWETTRDVVHLADARRRLDHLVAHVPPAYRASIVANVRCHREIAEAARANGV
jgi:serine/threonine protein kinase/tetratricopeptide (TPR) repeat protein